MALNEMDESEASDPLAVEEPASASVDAPYRSASIQPNEKLVSYVKDLSLAGRLLNVRVYQVSQSSGDTANCIGFRIAATDDGENDYALFVSRTKGEKLFRAQDLADTGDATGEAIASSILAHLDIIGNRYRDVGRLICREPEAHETKKTRLARPKTPTKVRNAHLPTKEQDKRASRNKQSQQRVLDAIAHSHGHRSESNGGEASAVDGDLLVQPLPTFHAGLLLTGDSQLHKSRKSSEASLLNRMANAQATTVWNAELEGIGDEPGGVVDDAEGSESDTSPPPSAPHAEVASTSVVRPPQKRVLPERKAKYSELQKRRDKERQQRYQVVRPAVLRTPVAGSSPPRQASPPRQSSLSPATQTRYSVSKTPAGSPVAASAAIGNALALKTFVGGAPPEQEQFLRRKTIIENQKRVFKAEGVFDEALGVEITHERPDRRFHTPEHAPRTPEIEVKKRTSHRKKLKGSGSTTTIPSASPSVETFGHSLAGSASAPELASPREITKATPPEVAQVELEGGTASDPMVLFVAQSNGPSASNGDDGSDEEEGEDASPGPLENSVDEDSGNSGVEAETGNPTDETSHRSPRSARASDTELLLEEDPLGGHDAVESDAQQVNAMQEDETMGESHTATLQPTSGTPRVECWEEDLVAGPTKPAHASALAESDPSSGDVEAQPTKPWAPAPLETDESQLEQVDSRASAASPVTREPLEDPVVVVEHSAAPQTALRKSTQPDKAATSPSLKRPVNAHMARRGSVMDAAATAIAAAAAAAAVSASTVPPTEASVEPVAIPKSDSGSRSAKRRSHDAIPARVSGSAGHKRDGPWRSTVHTLHHSGSRKLSTISHAKATNSEDSAASSTTRPALDSIASSPPSTASSSSGSESFSTSTRTELHTPKQHRQRSQQELDAVRNSPTYHSKWNKWSNGKQLVDKVSCLQIEEQLLRDPHDVESLVKLGLKYARWPATSLPAVLLLENASILHDSNSGHTHEYWNSLGNAHFDVFLRHRKFLPIAIFHLAKSIQALTRAFAYLESAADPLLLLRYSVCLYWKKSDDNANVERADDILRELFAKFSSFCDRNRFNLLFFHFQILCRLKIFGEAIECLTTIMEMHAATTGEAAPVGQGVPPPYETCDYLLMLMHCQQVSGDFLQASATFSKLVKHLQSLDPDVLVDGSSLSDRDYLHLWGNLADKCFQHEDYNLSSEFYAIAVTYAKDSRVLARLLYHHALCYQAMGEELKCSAEFKRAKNINRHVVPFASLAEIHARYEDQYTTKLHSPVSKLIEEVRQNLYDRAVSALQRMFRRKKQSQPSEASDATDLSNSPKLHRSSSGNMRSGVERRRQSIVAALTNLVEESNSGRNGGAVVAGTSGETEAAVVVDAHEEFLQRHAATLLKLETLRERPLRKASSVIDMKATDGSRSGFLSPVGLRPDLRRKHSMDSYAQRLGYTPEGRGRYVDHWEQLVTTSLDLYETKTSLFRHISRIRSVLPLVSEAEACCALADAAGEAEIALERLHDSVYERELHLVCDVVDVPSIVQRHFAASTYATRFPPIKSPTKTPPSTTVSPRTKPPPQCKLPPCASPAPATRKTFHLDSLINDHFQTAGESPTTGAKPLLNKFEILDDFRQLNASLLHGWQR